MRRRVRAAVAALAFVLIGALPLVAVAQFPGQKKPTDSVIRQCQSSVRFNLQSCIRRCFSWEKADLEKQAICKADCELDAMADFTRCLRDRS